MNFKVYVTELSHMFEKHLRNFFTIIWEDGCMDGWKRWGKREKHANSNTVNVRKPNLRKPNLRKPNKDCLQQLKIKHWSSAKMDQNLAKELFTGFKKNKNKVEWVTTDLRWFCCLFWQNLAFKPDIDWNRCILLLLIDLFIKIIII